MSWLALDIGGANLKAADGLGWARTVPFALWREPENLAVALSDLMNGAPRAEQLVVTMTGELCDCFRTKVEGVRRILDAVREAADGREVLVYLVDGRLVPVEDALAVPHLAAASNWHALASFACRFVGSEPGLLIDIGSTTTDIIPLVDGKPRPQGFDDTARLLAGELVYTGVGRTPVCAVCRSLPWQGSDYPVAAELFATTGDAYLLLGYVPVKPESTGTADGRPMTLEFAAERMARMICADSSSVTVDDARRMAEGVCVKQVEAVEEAASHVLGGISSSPTRVVLSGEGEFLAAKVVSQVLPTAEVIFLASYLPRSAADAAPAHALAVLSQHY